MSINSQQSKLLATNYLDNLSKSNLSPQQALEEYKNLPEMERVLANYGAKAFFLNANKYINQYGLVASGNLSELLTFDIKDDSGTYTLSLGYHDSEVPYWKFVNYGVKGIKAGISKRGYAFKTANPSKKMVDAMVHYIGISAKATKTINQAINKKEAKQLQTAEQKAYLLAKLIKMYGIKPREYMEKAAKDTFNKDFQAKIALAVGNDIKLFIRKWQ